MLWRNAKRERLFVWALWFFAVLLADTAEQPSTRWEKEIQAFEETDRTNPPTKGAVLFVGSSSIRLWKTLAEDFAELTVINRGFGGSHIPDSTTFAERIIIPHKPSRVVLYAGDNDIARGDSPETVLRNFKQFAGKIRAGLPQTHIYFISIKPSPSRWYLSPQAAEANELIRRYCRFRPKLHYIDVWSPMLTESGQPDRTLFTSDNLHLNEKGYALWRRVVREALND